MARSVTLSVSMKPEQLTKITAMAERLGVSRSELIRCALTAFLVRWGTAEHS